MASTPLTSHDARHDGAHLPPQTLPAVIPLALTAGAVAWAAAVTLSDFSPSWPGIALAVLGFMLGGRVARPLVRGGVQFFAGAALFALLVQVAAVSAALWGMKHL